jgi:flagellar biosynthesis protein FliR
MPDFLTQVMAPANWPTFVMITARLTGLMLVAPLWSMAQLPRTVRAAVTVLLALLLLPLAPRVTLPAEVIELPLPLAVELAVGIAIGLTAAVLVQGAAMAGEVVSLQMGLSLGPALAPSPELQVPGVGQLQGALALLLYVSLGGHLVLLRGLADSLQALPPGSAVSIVGGAGWCAAMVWRLFAVAVCAAAPVMVTLLLVNLALGALNRAVPQLNALMVSLPLSIAVGLIALGASLPMVASSLAGWMGDLPASVGTAVSGFQPTPAGP